MSAPDLHHREPVASSNSNEPIDRYRVDGGWLYAAYALTDIGPASTALCFVPDTKGADLSADLLNALGAIGVIGDGYCFCSHDRDPHRETHEPECKDARAAIAKAERNHGGQA